MLYCHAVRANMTDTQGDASSAHDAKGSGDAALVRRLHPMSFIFLLSSHLTQWLFPLLALLFAGRSSGQIYLVAPALFAALTAWAVLRARAYSYQITAGELLVRDGVFDRTQRHIPLARIHNVSQRRKLMHRLLGVTEVRLESAAGGRPEATMQVLGMAEAHALEAVLRGHAPAVDASDHPGPNPATAHADADGQADNAAALHPTAPLPGKRHQLLHALSRRDIVLTGLISNRGMVVVALLFATLSQHRDMANTVFGWLGSPGQWLRQTVVQQVRLQQWETLALTVAALALLAFVLLRLLSVVLAFVRYNGFRLEQHGDKLVAVHGLSTHVRSGARLARLQRWQIDETWLHRRFGRCRLAVTVAGNMKGGQHGLEADVQFNELAPIASWPEAQRLLAICLPGLHWPDLHWQPLQRAFARRWLAQARWVVPLALLGVYLGLNRAIEGLPPTFAVLVAMAALVAWTAWTAAWSRFAAYAENNGVLLYRSGVWHKRWVIVHSARLHTVRLTSSPLDRTLGLLSLQASAQGGSKSPRAIQIPCLSAYAAQAMRQSIWQSVQRTAR